MLLSQHLCICCSCCLGYPSAQVFHAVSLTSYRCELRDLVRKAFLGQHLLLSTPLLSLKYYVYIWLVYLPLVGCKIQEGEDFFFIHCSLLCLHQCLTHSRWFLCMYWMNWISWQVVISILLPPDLILLTSLFICLPWHLLSPDSHFSFQLLICVHTLLFFSFLYMLLWISLSFLASFIVPFYILFLVNFIHALCFHYHLLVDESQTYTCITGSCITAPDLGISLDSSCKYCYALLSSANLPFYYSLSCLVSRSLTQARTLALSWTYLSFTVHIQLFTKSFPFSPPKYFTVLSIPTVLVQAPISAPSWTTELVTWLVW